MYSTAVSLKSIGRKPLKRLHGDYHSTKEKKTEKRYGFQELHIKRDIGSSKYDSAGNKVAVNHNEDIKAYSYSENSVISESYTSQEPKSAIIESNKYRKRIQELFGPDPEDMSIPSNVSPKQDTIETCNKNTNYMSTTVNVNIYNSPVHCESNSIVQRHSENSMINVGDLSPKRLRIDVSLSHDKPDNSSTYVTDNDSISSKKSHKHKSKRKIKHSKSNHQKDDLNKDKVRSSKTTKPPSANTKMRTVSPDEDREIKELWSILGMESPSIKATKHQSESIKEKKLHPGNQTITLHRAPSIELSLEHKNSESHHNQLEDNAAAEVPENIEQEMEPVCKIAETFSLAEVNDVPTESFNLGDVNDDVPDLFELATKSSSLLNRSSVSTNCSEALITSYNKTMGDKNIEIISLCDDDSNGGTSTNIDVTSNRDTTVSTVKEKAKVGTIRVKSIGSLMGPSSPVASTSTDNAQENVEVNKTKPMNTDVEIRFCNTYQFYFVDHVTSKIPKLGELLHLAIADKIRKNERIKRAEQLSSDDLIKEEKQRADKDFNDMMRIRGDEFVPLFEIILKKFDHGSKITLFISLFCRILSHAEHIDPANKGYVLDARQVIYVMLLKHSFNGKEILDILSSNEDAFKEQVKLVNNLIEKCVDDGNRTSNPEALTSTNMITNPNETVETNQDCTPNNNLVEISSGLFQQNLILPETPNSHIRNIPALPETSLNTGRSNPPPPNPCNDTIQNNQYTSNYSNVQGSDSLSIPEITPVQIGHRQALVETSSQMYNNQALANNLQGNHTKTQLDHTTALQKLTKAIRTQAVSQTSDQITYINSAHQKATALQEASVRTNQGQQIQDISYQITNNQAAVNNAQQSNTNNHGPKISALQELLTTPNQSQPIQDISYIIANNQASVNNVKQCTTNNRAPNNSAANQQSQITGLQAQRFHNNQLNMTKNTTGNDARQVTLAQKPTSTSTAQVLEFFGSLNGTIYKVPNNTMIIQNNPVVPVSYPMVPTMSTQNQIGLSNATQKQPTTLLQAYNVPNVRLGSSGTTREGSISLLKRNIIRSQQQPAVNDSGIIQNPNAVRTSSVATNSPPEGRPPPAETTHVVVNKLGSALNRVNIPGKKYNPLIIRDLNSASSAPIVEDVNPTTTYNIVSKANALSGQSYINSTVKDPTTLTEAVVIQRIEPAAASNKAIALQHHRTTVPTNLQNRHVPRIIQAKTSTQVSNMMKTGNSQSPDNSLTGNLSSPTVISGGSRQCPTTVRCLPEQTVSDQTREELGTIASLDTLEESSAQSSISLPSPTTSHCHPFVKRMPISGKMKMFFGK